jgi:hypothetical protein
MMIFAEARFGGSRYAMWVVGPLVRVVISTYICDGIEADGALLIS